KEGDRVLAGDALFYSKYAEELKFASPVSGTVQEIKRGAKRRILEVIIEADFTDSYKDFGKLNAASANVAAVRNMIYSCGCGAFINQRSYDIVSYSND